MQKNKLKEKKYSILFDYFYFYKHITLSEVKGTICKDRKFQELSVIKEGTNVVGAKTNSERTRMTLVLLRTFSI